MKRTVANAGFAQNLNGVPTPNFDEDFEIEVIGKRRAIADAAGTLNSNDNLIVYTSITAARAFTLGAASLYKNRVFIFKDESGQVTASFKVTAVGTVDGASNPDILAAAYASKRLYSNGTAWFFIA